MQFHPGLITKYLLRKALPDWAKTQFNLIKTQFQPNSTAELLPDIAFSRPRFGADMRGMTP
jgi:hypothetical protein